MISQCPLSFPHYLWCFMGLLKLPGSAPSLSVELRFPGTDGLRMAFTVTFPLPPSSPEKAVLFHCQPQCRDGHKSHLYYAFLFFFNFLMSFLGPHLQPMEIPRLGVQSELQLPAYSTATATPDPCFICNLHHSSWQQGQGLNLHPHGY